MGVLCVGSGFEVGGLIGSKVQPVLRAIARMRIIETNGIAIFLIV
jgi:hypothetical protein